MVAVGRWVGEKRYTFDLLKNILFLPPFVLHIYYIPGKPFAVLLPLTVLHSKLLRDVLDTKHVQAIIPRRVMVRKATSPEEKTEEAAVPFKFLVWLCYRMELPSSLIFV